LALLAGGAAAVLFREPQRLLANGWPTQFSGATAVPLFALAYGLCATVFVPRPLLNVAAGSLLAAQSGLAAALAGTVLAAGLSFMLGRTLGREALRPLLRGRVLLALDNQLGRHGFRSTLAMRLFPGMPFAAVNYGAAVSRMRLAPFLLATALGSVPNTAAYVVAGSHATSPASPVFLLAMGFVAVTGAAAVPVGWRARGLRARRAEPPP
jgi:uncharacterized membrane protein YdjX (TVP38/TMEM64 family)